MAPANEHDATKESIDWSETVSMTKWSSKGVENLVSGGSEQSSLDGTGEIFLMHSRRAASPTEHSTDQDDFSAASVNRRLDEILTKVSLLTLPNIATDEEQQDMELIRNMANPSFEKAAEGGGKGQVNHSRNQNSSTNTVGDLSTQSQNMTRTDNENPVPIHRSASREISGLRSYERPHAGDAAEKAVSSRLDVSSETKVGYMACNAMEIDQQSDAIRSRGDAFERQSDTKEGMNMTRGVDITRSELTMHDQRSYLDPGTTVALPRKQADPSYPYYRQNGTGRLGIAERVDVFQSVQLQKPSLSSTVGTADGVDCTPRTSNTAVPHRDSFKPEEDDQMGTARVSNPQIYLQLLTQQPTSDSPASYIADTFPRQNLPLSSNQSFIQPAHRNEAPQLDEVVERSSGVLYLLRQPSSFRDQAISSQPVSHSSPIDVEIGAHSLGEISQELSTGWEECQLEQRRRLFQTSTSAVGEDLRQPLSPFSASVRSTWQGQEDEPSQANNYSSTSNRIQTIATARDPNIDCVALTDRTRREHAECHVRQHLLHTVSTSPTSEFLSSWPGVTDNSYTYQTFMSPSMEKPARNRALPSFTHRSSGDMNINLSPKSGAFATQPGTLIHSIGRFPPHLSSDDVDCLLHGSQRASIEPSSRNIDHPIDTHPSHPSAMCTHVSSRSGLRPPSLVGRFEKNDSSSVQVFSPFRETLRNDRLPPPIWASMPSNLMARTVDITATHSPTTLSYEATKSFGATNRRQLGQRNSVSCRFSPPDRNVSVYLANGNSLVGEMPLQSCDAQPSIGRNYTHKESQTSLLWTLPRDKGYTRPLFIDRSRRDKDVHCVLPPVSAATREIETLSNDESRVASFLTKGQKSTTEAIHSLISDVDLRQAQNSPPQSLSVVDNFASYSNTNNVKQGSWPTFNSLHSAKSEGRDQPPIDKTHDFFETFGSENALDFQDHRPISGHEVVGHMNYEKKSRDLQLGRMTHEDDLFNPDDLDHFPIERRWYGPSPSVRFSNMRGVSDASHMFWELTSGKTNRPTHQPNADSSILDVEYLRDTDTIRHLLDSLGHGSRESWRDCETSKKVPTRKQVAFDSRTSITAELDSLSAGKSEERCSSSVSGYHEVPRLDTFSQQYELSNFWMNRITPRSQGLDPPNDQKPASVIVTSHPMVKSRTLRDPPYETSRSVYKKPQKEPEGHGLRRPRSRLMETMVCSSCSSSTGVVERVTTRIETHDDDSDLFENIEEDSSCDKTDQPLDQILGPPLDVTPTADAPQTVTRRFRTIKPTQLLPGEPVPSTSKTSSVIATEIGTVTSSMYAVHEGKRSSAPKESRVQSQRIPELIKAESLEVYHEKSSVHGGEGKLSYPEILSEKEKSEQTLSYWQRISDVKTLGSFDSVTLVNQLPPEINKPATAGTEIAQGSFRQAAPLPPPMDSTQRKRVKDRLLRIGPLLSPSSDTLDSLTADSDRDSAEQNTDNSKGCGVLACGDGDWLRGLNFPGFW